MQEAPVKVLLVGVDIGEEAGKLSCFLIDQR